MSIKSLLLGLAMVASSALPALAADWWLVSLGKDKFVTADLSTLETRDELGRSPVWLWLQWRFLKAQPNGHTSEKWLVGYDCDAREMRVKVYIEYRDGGEVVKTINGPMEWRPVPPESINEDVLRFACNASLAVGKGSFQVEDDEYYQVSDLDGLTKFLFEKMAGDGKK